MFDLSQDFTSSAKSEDDDDDDEPAEGTRKRRRRNGKENPSGAGGVIADEALSTGLSRKIRKITSEDADEAMGEDMDVVPAFEGEDALAVVAAQKEKANHWHTFKYRPILGVVCVGEGDGEEGEGIEVAVVERPIWEADLPPRYYGEQEWRERNSLE